MNKLTRYEYDMENRGSGWQPYDVAVWYKKGDYTTTPLEKLPDYWCRAEDVEGLEAEYKEMKSFAACLVRGDDASYFYPKLWEKFQDEDFANNNDEAAE